MKKKSGFFACFLVAAVLASPAFSCDEALIILRHFEDSGGSLNYQGRAHANAWADLLKDIGKFNQLIGMNLCPVSQVYALATTKPMLSAQIISTALNIKPPIFLPLNKGKTDYAAARPRPNYYPIQVAPELPKTGNSIVIFLNRESLWSTEKKDNYPIDPQSFLNRITPSSSKKKLMYSGSTPFAYVYVARNQNNDAFKSFNDFNIFYETYAIEKNPPQCNFRIFRPGKVSISSLTPVPESNPDASPAKNWIGYAISKKICTVDRG